jgi:hypothetical protein
MVKRCIKLLQQQLRGKFSSFIFQFDIDDTIMKLDTDLVHLGYGMKPEIFQKHNEALRQFFEDNANVGHQDIEDKFSMWWEAKKSQYFEEAFDTHRQFLLKYIQHKSKFPHHTIFFNHEHKGVFSAMVGHLFPQFVRLIQMLAELKIPIAFTSKNPFIQVLPQTNVPGYQFMQEIQRVTAGKLKVWNEFSAIGKIDKVEHHKELYRKGIHGLYFDDSNEYFNPRKPGLYLDPKVTGFASAQVSKDHGVAMTNVLQALLRYRALMFDTLHTHYEFPELSLSPSPAVTHLLDN